MEMVDFDRHNMKFWYYHSAMSYFWGEGCFNGFKKLCTKFKCWTKHISIAKTLILFLLSLIYLDIHRYWLVYFIESSNHVLGSTWYFLGDAKIVCRFFKILCYICIIEKFINIYIIEKKTWLNCEPFMWVFPYIAFFLMGYIAIYMKNIL